MLIKNVTKLLVITSLFIVSLDLFSQENTESEIFQNISVSNNPLAFDGRAVKIKLSYGTSDENSQLPGIGFRLHYSSEMLSFAGTENTIANDIIVDGDGPYQDDSDFDNDSNTDKYIIFGWAALNGDWPNSSLPASLVDVVFNVSWEEFDQASITTPINFSKISTTEGYNFEATNYTLNVLPATWDFDGNGQVDALTDGLILLRYAFDVRGASLTDSVISPDSTMTSGEVQIAVEKALVIADVDGDGNVDALTDGLIVLRYMFGLTGENIIDSVVSANATRASAESIVQHMEFYMPNDSVLMTIASDNSVTNNNTDDTASDTSDTVTTGLCAQVVEADFISFNADCTVGTITGTIDTDYTLLEEVQYILSGVVKVGEGNVEITSAAQMQAIQDAGVTLTIRPGVEVKATSDGVLLVTRGSKMIANGTATKPITFSSLDDNYDGMGEWGGVIVHGFAPQYGQGATGACFAEGEIWCNVIGWGGDFGKQYGGNLPADSSGVIRYVRIAESGLVAGPNYETNGLTLEGVGHGTTIEYIQLHNNLDDGIEWFGGTVNVKYAVLTNNDDDDIDFDEGYQGNIQYALIIKNQTPGATPVGSNDPRGIELNSSDEDYTPETAGVIANVTIVGGDAANNAEQFGMRLRGSVTAAIHNSAVTGYDVTCARIDHSEIYWGSNNPNLTTEITMNNFLCDTVGATFSKEDPVALTNLITEAVIFDSNYGITNASANVGVTVIEAYDNGSGFVFDSTDFIGAVDPSAATTWYEEWIIPGSVN